MELAGKVALVTGASRGLGRSIALKLASQGALVAVNYAGNAEAAAATVAMIEAAGGQAFAVQAKLKGQAEAEALRDALDAGLAARGLPGRIDILINNIGGGDYGTILDADEAFYDTVFDNNCRAAFFLTRVLHDRIADFG
ncbi:MAG: SDR family NAD(P)-dependent oxidoreductase, partial [Sphingomonadales bacterium]|nr:SDR family NAD(P)-dependent oxidoreductase [Sphingomonadales bacterium]